MFKFLIVSFFMFLLLALLMGFSVLRMIRNFIFGSGDTQKKHKSQHRKSSSSSSRQQRSQHNTASSSRKKIISDDEGEYVDYEEVK